MFRPKNQKGAALTIVIITLILLTLLAGHLLSIAYNKKKMDDRIAARHTKAYYLAQAGVVDAQWRIRKNYDDLFTYPAAAQATTLHYYLININTGAISIGAIPPATWDVDVTISYDPVTLYKIESRASLEDPAPVPSWGGGS